MKISGYLFTISLSICLLSFVGKDHGPAKPNIVLILADDLGYGDLSCYRQHILQTPHIDQLAAEGIRFTQFYAGATVCAPSRASLLTGKHTGHTSVRGNSPAGQMVGRQEATLASVLKQQGYMCGIIGKWGVGNGLPLDDPKKTGFDHHLGYINMWHAHNFYPEFLIENGQYYPLEGNKTSSSFAYPTNMPEGAGVAQEKSIHAHNVFEREALNFINAHHRRPFFLFLSLNMPHANNEAGKFTGDGMEVPTKKIDGISQPDYGKFAGEGWPVPEKGFAKMIDMIDQTVGRIQEHLKSLDLLENTLIIFTSDNGPHQEGGHQMAFFDSNGPLRGMKRDLYEGGVRVPFIASWPGHIKSGTTSHHMSAFWDILPTFCDLSGGILPPDLDGISFLPTLFDQKNQQVHRFLYWEFYEKGGRSAVRQGNWKLVSLNIRDTSNAVVHELYDLSSDLAESDNVADQHPEVVSHLLKAAQSAHIKHPLISLYE